MVKFAKKKNVGAKLSPLAPHRLRRSPMQYTKGTENPQSNAKNCRWARPPSPFPSTGKKNFLDATVDSP